MPGVREQEGTASKDLCHSEFYFFIIFNLYFNRKLEKKKHFLDMPAVRKSWSRRAVFTVICALNPAKKISIRAEDSNFTRIHGASTFLD